jgi:hypothetical protein
MKNILIVLLCLLPMLCQAQKYGVTSKNVFSSEPKKNLL